MASVAQTERAALCETALKVGGDRPTLCGEWSVKDLVVHLLLREGSPAAIGIVVRPLAPLAERASRRIGARPLPDLVERLRQGPPSLSPFSLPKADETANALELFVHHEDIRRAQRSWSARDLGEQAENEIWSRLAGSGRLLARPAPDGVVLEDARNGAVRTLKKGQPHVTVRGRPGELALFLFGRAEQADVELLGEDGAVDRLRVTSLGM